MPAETIACRCEDVSEAEIEAVLDEGFTSLEAVKRILRCGMGHCQGRTCRTTIARMIVRKTGRPLAEVLTVSSRPPLKPTPIGILASAKRKARA